MKFPPAFHAHKCALGGDILSPASGSAALVKCNDSDEIYGFLNFDNGQTYSISPASRSRNRWKRTYRQISRHEIELVNGAGESFCGNSFPGLY